jgi:hypothetical protein
MGFRHALRRRQRQFCGNVSTRALRRRYLQLRRKPHAAPVRLCGTALPRASARWRPRLAHAAKHQIIGLARRRLQGGGFALRLSRLGIRCRSAPRAARPSGEAAVLRRVGAARWVGLSARPSAAGPCGGPPVLPRQVAPAALRGRASSNDNRAWLTGGAQILLTPAPTARELCGRAAASRRRARRLRQGSEQLQVAARCCGGGGSSLPRGWTAARRRRSGESIPARAALPYGSER